jgi:uncharacterized protein YceH (UPF0502 family)
MAADLKKKGGGDNASKARSLNRDAGKLVRKVARAPGPFRDTARALIEQFNLSFSTQDDDTDAKEIKTFTDAKEKSSELISEIADLQNEISQAKRTLPSKSPNGGDGRRNFKDVIRQNLFGFEAV